MEVPADPSIREQINAEPGPKTNPAAEADLSTPITDGADAQLIDAQPTDGESTDGESTDGESTDDESTDDEATDDEATEDEATSKRKKRSIFAELPVLILIALTLAVVVKTLAFQAFFIPSGSMVDALEIDDRVLVNKLVYRFGDPQRGHVVVFDRTPNGDENVVGAFLRNLAESVGLRTPEADLIKRVIALPGETIEIRRNTVFIDGVPLDEPYLMLGTRTDRLDAVTVPEGEYFVMGDNRSQSFDSRRFGTIAREEIVGKAFVIIWPRSRWSGL